MSVRVVCVILLLAACGGTASSPRPTSSDPTERLLLTLEWFEGRACACTDRACAEMLDDEIADTLKPIEVPRLYKVESATTRADEAMQGSIRCMWKQGVVAMGFGKISIDLTDSFRREACACSQSGCTVEISKEDGVRVLHLISLPLDEAGREAMEKSLEEMMACPGAVLPESNAAALALEELTALRDRACACSTAACASEVTTEFEAWAKRHASVKGSDEQATRANTIATEISTCMVAAMKGAK